MTNAIVREWALRYAALGWKVFPLWGVNEDLSCQCGETGCSDTGKHTWLKWGKKSTTDPAVIAVWFADSEPVRNLGLVTGSVSNLTILDVDVGPGKHGMETWQDLTRDAGEPVTLTAKTGGGGFHYLFPYYAGLKTRKGVYGTDSDVDCRNDMGYVVAAPSRHKSGGAYEWLNWGTALTAFPSYLVPQETRGRKSKDEPRPPTLEEVEAMLAIIPADDRTDWINFGVILGRTYNQSDEAWALYVTWADKWTGTKGRGHDKTMHTAFYETSQHAATGKELSIATILKKAVEHGYVPSSITQMNQTYAVVFMGGDCKILREHTNPDTRRLDVSFASKNDVKLFHAHEPMILVGKKLMDVVDLWLCTPAHRRYEGVTFLPGPTPEGFYNLWRGFAVEPREGECSLMLAHIQDVICAGNTEHAKYLMAWLANVVQHPTERPGVAVVMRGGQGIGKGQFAKHFGSLFTPHFVPLTKGRHLLGNFNSLLRDALVVFADEAFWAGDKQGEGTLNALITEETHMIELKGIDPVPVKNYIHLIVASNHEWVVPAGPDARRFFVLDVAKHRKEDFEYFGKLTQQMENGGREAFLYYLQRYDFRDVDLRRAPKTDALKDQKLQSMSPIEKWWYGILKEGSVFAGASFYSQDAQGWPLTPISTSALHDLYLSYAGKLSLNRKATEMELAKTLKALAPGMNKARPYNEKGEQVRGWEFPPLAECRTAFDTRMNWTTNWDEEPT